MMGLTKIKIYVTTAVLLAAMALFGACKKTETPPPQLPPATQPAAVTLSLSSAQVPCFETVELTAFDADGKKTDAEWSVLNDAVATVSQSGIVRALQTGATTVVAKANDGVAMCSVTVLPKRQTAVIKNILSEITISENANYVLHPMLYFNGEKTAETYTFEFFSSDENTVSASSDGILTAIKKGSARITVSTEFFGMAITGTIDVSVTDDVELITDKRSLDFIVGEDLYGHGVNTYNVAASLSVNGQETSGIVWESDDESVATVNGSGTITAVKAGDAVISASYENDGNKIETQIAVAVRKPTETKNIQNILQLYTRSCSTLIDELAFDDDEEVLSITDVKNAGAIAYDGITNEFANPDAIACGDARWLIKTNFGTYDVGLFVVTRVISSVADWPAGTTEGQNVNNPNTGCENMNRKGYYVLGADIDVNPGGTGYVQLNPLGKANDSFFEGVFDGKGYKIKNNYIQGQYGLFGTIASSAQVKNLAYTQVRSNYTVGGTFAFNISGEVKDVYIELSATAKYHTNSALVAREITSTATLSNVIIDIEKVKPFVETLDKNIAEGNDVRVIFLLTRSGATFDEVYAYFGKLYLSDGTTEAAGNIRFSDTIESDMLYRDRSNVHKESFADWDSDVWTLPTTDGEFPTLKSM